MHKRLLIWMGIFFSLATCQAQEQVDLGTKNVCGWSKEVTQKTVWTFATGEDDSVRIYVREICKREALDYSFGVVAANVDNVIATIDNGQRYIYYSRAFFESLSNHWYKLAILAHEIGHHINNNVTGSDERRRPEQELAADRFAGKVLCEFGAPHSVIRQLLVETCSEKGSAFYPDRSARLEAFLDGYVVAGCHSTSPTPIRTASTTTMPGFSPFNLQKTFRDLPVVISLNDKHHLLMDDNTEGSGIRVRDMFSGNVVKTFPGHQFGCAINNIDHMLVATRTSEDSLVVFDYTSQKPLHRFKVEGMESQIKFSSRDRFLGVQTGDRFHLFDLAGNKEIETFSVDGHRGATGDFCFSPDEKLLAVAVKPGIIIYSLETFRVVKKIALPEVPWAFEFIPRKDQLVWSCGENYFRIVDLDGKQIREIKFIVKESELAQIDKEYDNEDPKVFALAVSPDGKYIAAGGSFTSGRIRIFTLQGNLAQTIREEQHNGGIMDLLFSSDGRYLIAVWGGTRDLTRIYRNSY